MAAAVAPLTHCGQESQDHGHPIDRGWTAPIQTATVWSAPSGIVAGVVGVQSVLRAGVGKVACWREHHRGGKRGRRLRGRRRCAG